MKQTFPNSKELLVAESPAMRAVADAVADCASRDCPVLIEGEPGTGRELIARVIHLDSLRQRNDFVTVKGSTAPTAVFSDQMANSSSTLRRAQGGTLMIKDLVALPKKSQQRLTKLLCPKVGQTAEVHDVRVIGTTDPDLNQGVRAGVFSSELYDCFARARIVIPPLRERADDIAPLATALIRSYGKSMGRSRIRVSIRAFERMITYPWPGNVAELKNVCRRLVLHAEGNKIDVEHVEEVLPIVAERAPLEDLSFEDMVRAKLSEFLRKMDGYPLEGFYDDVLARVERPLLALIMERTGNNQVKAAEILGVSRNTLRRKLTERGIRPQAKAAKRTLSGTRHKKAADR